MATNPESLRLQEARAAQTPWKKWGPYLSERQWGTVREDYSESGDAWNYFTHDQARSRAYRWGEDGLAGFSDDRQQLCFALALWNGADAILKERLFGLTNTEGNHGEDVKEYYFYLDSTPTHSYMKYLYKYPQRAYPYDQLVRTNRARSRYEFEYELLDTGIFNDDRYFDLFVEYAKESPEEILIRITAFNRGAESAPLHILPTLWFRNTWSWEPASEKPILRALASPGALSGVAAFHPVLGERFLYCDGRPELLFTENETNRQRLFNAPNMTPYVKDAFHEFLIHGNKDKVNPQQVGTKAAAHYPVVVPAGQSQTICLRISAARPDVAAKSQAFGPAFDAVFARRTQEANEFYDSTAPAASSADEKNVMRQALAGMLWSKQYYYLDVDRWLVEHGVDPATSKRKVRNSDWFHMVNDDVISMPDKWEYPWFAAWDLAFHTAALSMVDVDFAKDQINLMLREVYLHPNGQIPAYEWNFGDVNPPVHARAVLFLYRAERYQRGKGDLEFLKHAFQKLLLNFTWWVNRKDRDGHNIFEGGFLGLDNIGVFDRSAPCPGGGFLEQADGTAWMALFCQNMFEIAIELAATDLAYEPMAVKFIEHFFWIAGAMDRVGLSQDDLWDEEDGFFYDLLVLPDGAAQRIKVRSMVGLLPLCAVAVIPGEVVQQYPRLTEKIRKFIQKRPVLIANIAPPEKPGYAGRHLLAVVREPMLRRMLERMLDENRFLGPYGIRSLSRWHLEHPYIFDVQCNEYRVQYLPAESNTSMFGGNSNWRGPVWFPVNLLIIRALIQLYAYYGDDFTIECPTGSGVKMNLFEVSREIARRLTAIFLRDRNGRRPVYGGSEKFQTDPLWRDHILFYEYFHGDNGAGLGASHQTGWTGLVARLIQLYGHLTAEHILGGEGHGVTTTAVSMRAPA